MNERHPSQNHEQVGIVHVALERLRRSIRNLFSSHDGNKLPTISHSDVRTIRSGVINGLSGLTRARKSRLR